VSTPVKRRLVLSILIIAVLILAGTVPIPHTVKGPCVLNPAAVWYIANDGAGQLISGWEHNYLDAGGVRALLQFDRPDFVEVFISPRLREGEFTYAGDTVAFIASQEGIGHLRVLEAEYKGAQAELDLILAGFRNEEIEIAQRSVERAHAALDGYQPEMDRIKSQYKTGVVTLSIFQEAEGEYQLYEAELRLAEAELTAIQAEARPEDVAIFRANVERLQRSLETSEFLTGKTRPVITPISGKVRLCGVDGIILKIERIDTLAAITLLPEATLGWLKQGQPIVIDIVADSSIPLHGLLNRIDFTRSDQVGGYTGPYGITFIDNRNSKLQTGMTGKTRMETGSQTLLSVIKAKFSSRGL